VRHTITSMRNIRVGIMVSMPSVICLTTAIVVTLSYAF